MKGCFPVSSFLFLGIWLNIGDHRLAISQAAKQTTKEQSSLEVESVPPWCTACWQIEWFTFRYGDVMYVSFLWLKSCVTTPDRVTRPTKYLRRCYLSNSNSDWLFMLLLYWRFLQGDPCCWSCDRCDPWEYVESEFKCADCGDGRWPYDDKKACYDLEVKYTRWDSLMAMVPVCVACVGIVLTLTVIIIFLRHSETPIVKVRLKAKLPNYLHCQLFLETVSYSFPYRLHDPLLSTAKCSIKDNMNYPCLGLKAFLMMWLQCSLRKSILAIFLLCLIGGIWRIGKPLMNHDAIVVRVSATMR